MIAKAADEAAATLWHCEACRRSGVALWQGDTTPSVYTFVDEIVRIHSEAEPNCKGLIAQHLKVTRPVNWYAKSGQALVSRGAA
jgi:hypothetical protein